MKFKLLIFFILIELGSIAQEHKTLLRPMLLYSYDANFISNGNLNKYLNAGNYHGTDNTLLINSLGFTIRATENPSLLNITFSQGSTYLDNSESMSAVKMLGFGFEYGYDLLKSEKWLIAPTLAVKHCKYELVALSKSSKSYLGKESNIEEYFQTQLNTVASLGVQLDRKISISYLNVFVGIRGGYSLDLFSRYWYNINKKKLSEIPSISLTGFNIAFCMNIELNMDKIRKKRLIKN